MRSGERLNVLDAKICARRGLAVSARKQYAEYKLYALAEVSDSDSRRKTNDPYSCGRR